MMQTESEILTGKDAAGLLGLSESAVYKLLQQGDLPGGKIGGQWRLRRSDLDRAFDLARARATAQQREKEAPAMWEDALIKLRATHHNASYELTRCLWCPEWIPTWHGVRYTTLCSLECVAELRRTFAALGWPVTSDYVLSPIHQAMAGDGTELMLGQWSYEAERDGFVPDHELTKVRYSARHGRGPLRELLLLEHPFMRDYNGFTDVAEVSGASGRAAKVRTRGGASQSVAELELTA